MMEYYKELSVALQIEARQWAAEGEDMENRRVHKDGGKQ